MFPFFPLNFNVQILLVYFKWKNVNNFSFPVIKVLNVNSFMDFYAFIHPAKIIFIFSGSIWITLRNPDLDVGCKYFISI